MNITKEKLARTRPAGADARLHAATEGIRAADLEGAESTDRDRAGKASPKGDADLPEVGLV